MTTVFYVVSTFVIAKSLDIFIKTSGQFPNVLVARKPDIFEETSVDFPAVWAVTKQGKIKSCIASTVVCRNVHWDMFAKRETIVQYCVSTFVSVKPLTIFIEM